MTGARAQVARAGRIYVEGRHDAQLVEQVWGDDLRIEGVVVEYLGDGLVVGSGSYDPNGSPGSTLTKPVLYR